MAEDNNMDFLRTSSFTEEDISKACQCFGENLLNDLKEELKQNPFSISLDSATIAGENICAFEDNKRCKWPSNKCHKK